MFAENIKLGKRRANPGVIPPPPCHPSPPSCLVSFVPICPAGFSLICHVPGRASTGEGEQEPDGERMGGGASHGEGDGERDRPTGAWLAKSSSDLEKALMCTDGAGWEQNQLGWRRTCSARGWFGAGCVHGSELAPCSSPLPPAGRQRWEGEVRRENSPPTFPIDE